MHVIKSLQEFDSYGTPIACWIQHCHHEKSFVLLTIFKDKRPNAVVDCGKQSIKNFQNKMIMTAVASTVNIQTQKRWKYY